MWQTIVSSDSLKNLFVNKEELYEKLKEISEEIKFSFKFIKGLFLSSSFDLDLIIVVDKIPKEDFWNIYEDLYNFIAEKIDMGIDLLIIEEKEFNEKKEKFGKIVKL